MCALFRQGLKINQVPLDEDPPARHDASIMIEADSRSVDLIGVGVHRDVLGTTAAAMHAMAMPPIGSAVHVYAEEQPIEVTGRRLAPQPLGTRRQALGALGLATRVRPGPETPPPRVHQDLEAARGREVLKRAVLPRFLTPAQAAHWQKRMGESKRVSPRWVELVGVFPDVAIAGEAPVHYRSEEAAIAYQLPSEPVPLTTVVIARHQRTGELLLGRFHRL